MIKIFVYLFAFLTLTASRSDAADSCRILFNKKVVFQGAVEEENAIVHLKANTFKRTDCITITYKSETKNKGWKRTYYIVANEKDIKTIETPEQSGSVSVKASALNEVKTKREPVFVYTMSLPKDPKLAARIRVRRILLCKVEWN